MKKNNPLVTVLTPCYNAEKYIQDFLKSIISQTYNNIQLIMVNDGSSDKTEEKILAYEEKILKRGFEFIYLYQANAGQAAAVNNGLKKVKGDYLTWPDCDDIISNDSIEKKVMFLEKNANFGLVNTNMKIVLNENKEKVVKYITPKTTNQYIFMDILEEKIYCTPGAYMIRMSSFKKINPELEIYTKMRSQNWQMLLPISYKYKCGHIDEFLFTYVVRNDSSSHNVYGSLEKEIARSNRLEDILKHVLPNIKYNNELKLKELLEYVKIKYIRKRYYIYLKYRDRKDAKLEYNKLKKSNNLTPKDILHKFLDGNIFIDIYRKLKKKQQY